MTEAHETDPARPLGAVVEEYLSGLTEQDFTDLVARTREPAQEETLYPASWRTQ
ncbi:hypothetical protein KKP62_17705 [Rhodococcus sp. GOMB7]|jgi:hypothetical protein|uniref:Uncharacterized protein n=1 Tax=Rhodococcus erythropolis TaxID=1833 RepID=A0A6G9CP23_RHOER|nr:MULTISPECIES: hypothetical protein [Rhodococcus]MBT9296802.1 hypothetical protein [Rhodococcus sp. GOMB7]MCJ0947212.1 hypothetical protein [Rhodococcus sp. ARC_M8]MDI9941796.1 hypothetical protein [Rhodococcus sp. IEGM 1302]MEA1795725.1 hypothetical protein [Rhodococcus qingshengii]QIP38619.1 hypothetical protein G9444_1375 [Rhodococcus erythropolis]